MGFVWSFHCIKKKLNQIPTSKIDDLLPNAFLGSISPSVSSVNCGSSLRSLATSWCLDPTMLRPLMDSIMSPMQTSGYRDTTLPSLTRLTNANPAPLSVMVSPREGSVLLMCMTLGEPLTCAYTKSSSPIWAPRRRAMSILWVLRVQKII